MVIDVEIVSSGSPRSSRRMSSSESMATPTRPTSPRGERVVRVAAHLRRQIERDREARLPLLEQVVVARVRLVGACRSRRTGASSRAAAVHVRLDAARERRLAGKAEISRRVEADVLEIVGTVEIGRIVAPRVEARLGRSGGVRALDARWQPLRAPRGRPRRTRLLAHAPPLRSPLASVRMREKARLASVSELLGPAGRDHRVAERVGEEDDRGAARDAHEHGRAPRPTSRA